MTSNFYKLMAMAAGAVFLNGCAGAINSIEHAGGYERNHPIAVDSQIVSLTLNVDSTTQELSSLDSARIRAFADAYLRDGHGPITVTAPSGRTDDLDGQETAADVRSFLHASGVPWSSISGATYRTGDDRAGQLVLSYTHYVATPSECGNWKGIAKTDRRNLISPNFGCAAQNNLAAMVADPRDLITPADIGDPDAMARIRAVQAFREGEISSVATDQDIQSDVSQ